MLPRQALQANKRLERGPSGHGRRWLRVPALWVPQAPRTKEDETMDEPQNSVLTVILGGGRGTRLFPLTQYRCKPAVPLAGTYRLPGIPISTCLNAGYYRIFVLTQFLTASLHRHIHGSFQFDPFSGGFVEILAAEQTDDRPDWYQGTADAVRRNLQHFVPHAHDLVLILSGDQ